MPSHAQFAQVIKDKTTGALGRTWFTATRDLSRFSQGAWAGAANLVGKALDALSRGDTDRAERFLVRAAGLPWDEHEQRFPGLGAMSHSLFNVVIDELEACEPGDEGWLDAALDVLPTLDETAARQLLDVLRTAVQDYQLSRREAARIRRVLPPDLIAPDEVDPTTTPGEIATVMRSIAAAQLAYVRAAAAGEPR